MLSVDGEASITALSSRGAIPGSQLNNTLYYQISDYFSFGDLVLTDVISDGHRFVNNSAVSFIL